MLRALFAVIVVVFGAAAAATYFAMFIVHQNEQAIVLEFGKPVTIINEPGLYWKVPVVQTVEYFDKRILDLDTAPQLGLTLLATAAHTPVRSLRTAGAVAVAAGFVIVWLVRG